MGSSGTSRNGSETDLIGPEPEVGFSYPELKVELKNGQQESMNVLAMPTVMQTVQRP